MIRRPVLLSSVMLRQNPHNVHEWHKRVKLFKGEPTKQILTYTEAVKTVSCEKAVGKLHILWCAFAKFYEYHGDLDNARVIFKKATQVPPSSPNPTSLWTLYLWPRPISNMWMIWHQSGASGSRWNCAMLILRGHCPW